MKGLFSIFLVLSAVLAAGVLTLPDQQSHYDEIHDIISEIVQEDTSAVANGGYTAFDGMLSLSSVTQILNQCISVDNYLLFNVGKITFDGEVYPVTLGLFSHVFMSRKEKVKTQINESLEKLFLPVSFHPIG